MARTTARPASRRRARSLSRKAIPIGTAVEGVSEVVDQVGQQRDRAREDEDGRLDERRQAEEPEAERDCPEARPRPQNRGASTRPRMAVGVRGVSVRVRRLHDPWRSREPPGERPRRTCWDAVDRLVEVIADMRVVQCEDDASAAPFAGHEAEVRGGGAQLVRDGRSIHRDSCRRVRPRNRATAQPSCDARGSALPAPASCRRPAVRSVRRAAPSPFVPARRGSSKKA